MKTSMKTKFFAVITLSAFLLPACSNDPSEDTGNGEVRFTSAIAVQPTETRAADAAWGTGDAIGIYMFDTGTTTILENVTNRKYVTAAGDGKFAGASGQTIYYPPAGSVDFMAYYPHNTGLSGFTYPVDLSNQASQPAIDLMYSNNAVNKNKTNTNVPLNFSHQLTKLVMNVVAGDGIDNLTGLTVTIKGMDTKTTFDLETGVLSTTYTDPADITPAVTGTRYEAILLPVTALGTAHTVEFALGGDTYIWEMYDDIASLDVNKKYDYTITIRRHALGATGNITDWTPETGTGIAE